MAKKKANSRAVQRKEEEEEDKHVVEAEEGESSEVAFAGKKKSKKKKGNGFSKVSFELLDDEGSNKNEEVESENDIPDVSKKGGDVGSNKSRFEFLDNDDEEDAQSEDNEGGDESSKVVFAGKKKSKKKKGNSKVSFELLDDEGNDKDEEVESENDITVVSKKRGDVGFSKSGFGLLNDDEDEDAQSEDNDGDGAGATKSSFQLLEDEDNEGEDARSREDSVAPVSTGKKSVKKKKGASGFSSSNFDLLGEDEC